MKRQGRIALLQLILLALLLTGCNLVNTKSSDERILEDSVEQNQEDQPAVSNRAQQFVVDFPDAYPDFELLDYVYGDPNDLILLGAIAKNLKNNTSSTLFIVDENGVGQVVLASDYNATFRIEDGFRLEGNTVILSLDLQPHSDGEGYADQVNEIHDFEITVAQTEDGGAVHTVYSSKEVIREN